MLFHQFKCFGDSMKQCSRWRRQFCKANPCREKNYTKTGRRVGIEPAPSQRRFTARLRLSRGFTFHCTVIEVKTQKRKLRDTVVTGPDAGTGFARRAVYICTQIGQNQDGMKWAARNRDGCVENKATRPAARGRIALLPTRQPH